jgi:hypothetical protein
VTTAVSAPVRPRPSTAVCTGVGLALAAIVIVAGNYHVAAGENGGTGPGIETGVLCLLLAGLLFGFVVPRARRLERTTLILGILAVLSLAVFWSGITPVLAAASYAVAARGADLGKKAAVGQALGLGAALLAVGWTLANSHLF